MDEGKQTPKRIVFLADELRSRLATWAIEGYPRETCGLKPLGHPGDIVPRILDESLIDERIPVTLDDALATCRQLAAQGLFVGPSSGAFVWGAVRLAATGRFRTLVTVLRDTGERYVSHRNVEAVIQARKPDRES